jgi:hypothetical protein
VPARVDPVDGVVVDVAVSVERLGVARVRDDRVGGDEAAQRRFVIPRVVIVEAGLGILFLAREAVPLEVLGPVVAVGFREGVAGEALDLVAGAVPRRGS